jgi:hypothetical protein
MEKFLSDRRKAVVCAEFLLVLFLGCFFDLGFDSFSGSVNNSLQ